MAFFLFLFPVELEIFKLKIELEPDSDQPTGWSEINQARLESNNRVKSLCIACSTENPIGPVPLFVIGPRQF